MGLKILIFILLEEMIIKNVKDLHDISMGEISKVIYATSELAM